MTDYESWGESEVANTINLFDIGDVRSTTLVVEEKDDSDMHRPTGWKRRGELLDRGVLPDTIR